MSAVGLESIEHTVQLTHTWVNDLDARLGWDNKHRSYRLLRTVLQAIPDWLKVEEAAKFGAQLPELLRGVYYEHWQPAKAPAKRRSKVDFIARIDHAFQTDPLVFTSEAISTVFQLLSDKITPGEIEHVHHALPRTSEHCGQSPPARREVAEFWQSGPPNGARGIRTWTSCVGVDVRGGRVDLHQRV